MTSLQKVFFISSFFWFLSGCAPMASPETVTPTQPPRKICADARANAFVWNDLNWNGRADPGEPPISGVCVTAYESREGRPDNVELCYRNPEALYLYTDEKGEWTSPEFVAGACGAEDAVGEKIKAQCNQEIIEMIPPSGYASTTETKIFGCRAEFGLAEET